MAKPQVATSESFPQFVGGSVCRKRPGVGEGRPPETSGTVILVGPDPGFSPRIGAFFDSVTVAGRIDNGFGVDDEEQGKSVFVLRGRQAPWSRIWSASPLVS